MKILERTSISKYLILGTSVLAIVACSSGSDNRYATHETILVNTKGDVKYCYYVNDTYEDSSNINGNYNKCINDAGSLGYKRVR